MAKKATNQPAGKPVKVVKAKAKGKRSGVSKSQTIRDYMKANPGDGPKAVVEALGKQGITVTAPQVSNVKAAAARKAGVKPMRRKGPGRPAAATSDKVSISDLMTTSSFVDKVGGVGAAKELISALEKLNK